MIPANITSVGDIAGDVVSSTGVGVGAGVGVGVSVGMGSPLKAICNSSYMYEYFSRAASSQAFMRALYIVAFISLSLTNMAYSSVNYTMLPVSGSLNFTGFPSSFTK